MPELLKPLAMLRDGLNVLFIRIGLLDFGELRNEHDILGLKGNTKFPAFGKSLNYCLIQLAWYSLGLCWKSHITREKTSKGIAPFPAPPFGFSFS